MRILIDENLPRKLAGHLQGYTCRTVSECGWSGAKNGTLLALADPMFDVLLTLDKNLAYQQDLKTVRIAVLIPRARSNRMQDLVAIIPECLATLERIQPRQVVRVGAFIAG